MADKDAQTFTKLPIAQVKHLPRGVKRDIWKAWWKNLRHLIKGDTRAEKRREWRRIWDEELATPAETVKRMTMADIIKGLKEKAEQLLGEAA